MPLVPSEVILEQYQLRSTFFAEKLDEFGFFDFATKIHKIIKDQENAFNWDERHEWGITENAWEQIIANELPPLSVFCHPRIVSHHPSLIRYYRSVALLPQKGMQKIAAISNLKEVEAGIKTVAPTKVNGVVTILNELMSSIITLTPNIDSEKIKGMMFATAGTTIDGSWRNQIGSEGERVIRSLLVKSLADNNEIIAIVDKNDNSYNMTEWSKIIGDPVASINHIKSVISKNGSSMFFSSEPDVTFMDSSGRVNGAIEIKAGIDPAGALERLGAMLCLLIMCFQLRQAQKQFWLQLVLLRKWNQD